MKTLRPVRPLSLLAFVLAPACGGGGDGAADAGAPKEVSLAVVKPAVALISAYRPHLQPAPAGDKYSPKQRPEFQHAAEAAANGCRHAANSAWQNIDAKSSPAAAELVAAFKEVSSQCADAKEEAALAKCLASVDALDASLVKNASASGATPLPHIAPESITDDAKKALADLVAAKEAGAAEQAYTKMRSDPAASVADTHAACQAAVAEASDVAARYEKAEQPIRVVAVTHKMAVEAQCNKIETADSIRAEVEGCRKNPRTADCKVSCGKGRAQLNEGLPAAAFEAFAKAFGEICKD